MSPAELLFTVILICGRVIPSAATLNTIVSVPTWVVPVMDTGPHTTAPLFITVSATTEEAVAVEDVWTTISRMSHTRSNEVSCNGIEVH